MVVESYAEVVCHGVELVVGKIYSMYQAVLETGVTGDMDASEICEQLKTGYTSMTFDGLTGTGMTWDASGAVSKDPKAVVIKDGAYAAM